ncbi:MAG: rhodanese-like domain-containing protein [Thiotrichales bacterium]|nr:rhodanese-like domain-containing protein [Thiotrichales bacterium]
MFVEFMQEQLLLFIALLVVVLMLVYSYVGDKISGFKTVSTDEAIRLYNDEAFVLDVRSAGEYREGYIGNALNISVSELPAKLSQLPADKTQPILVYCLSGGRSSRAAGILAKNGYQSVFNLSGGITAWKAGGLPVGRERSKKNRKNPQS